MAAVICRDSNQFQSPKQSCRVGLKCHHQCSSQDHFTSGFMPSPISAVTTQDYSRKEERALLLTFQPGRVTSLFLKSFPQTFWSFPSLGNSDLIQWHHFTGEDTEVQRGKMILSLVTELNRDGASPSNHIPTFPTGLSLFRLLYYPPTSASSADHLPNRRSQ